MLKHNCKSAKQSAWSTGNDEYQINENQIKRPEGNQGYLPQIFIDQVVQSGQKVVKQFRVSNSLNSQIRFGVSTCDTGQCTGTAEILAGSALDFRRLTKRACDFTVTIIVDLENETGESVVMLIDDVEVQKIPLSELEQYGGDRHRGQWIRWRMCD